MFPKLLLPVPDMNNKRHLGTLSFRAENSALELVNCWPLHSPIYLPARSMGSRDVVLALVWNTTRSTTKEATAKPQWYNWGRILKSNLLSFFPRFLKKMSSPSLPNRDLAYKSAISMHAKVSPFLAGLSENKMCGNHDPHDVTSLACGYADTSVITYQTDGEIRTSSKKIIFFYDTS